MIVNPDDRFDYGENRLIGIGFMNSIIAIVVFIEKKAEVIRIISARRANKNECKQFKMKSKTDCDKLKSISDSEINYSNIPKPGDSFFKSGKLRMPKAKPRISIRLDADVLEWFKSHGNG